MDKELKPKLVREGVCLKYPNCGVMLGSTKPRIDIYDSQGRSAGVITVEGKDESLILRVFHPSVGYAKTFRFIKEPRYTKIPLDSVGEAGEFTGQRHQDFEFHDFDWNF